VKGATLIEVLFSLAVVMGGSLAMARVLSSAVAGSNAAARVDHAEARAQTLLESIRVAPESALQCLADTPSESWSRCEKDCNTCLFSVGPAPYRLEKSFVRRQGRVWDAQIAVGWGGGHAVTLRSGVFR
jgi:hypothetical protein